MWNLYQNSKLVIPLLYSNEKGYDTSVREGDGGVFSHRLIREYCLSGKLPKKCFEGLLEE